MTVELRNFSSGLAADKEMIVQTPPVEPYWSENLLFALYDAQQDIGMWLHLGTVPNDWELWEDRIFLTLPHGGGTLNMAAFHKTVPELRPGGPCLHFRCIEPFRRWVVTYDGYAHHTSEEDMHAGNYVSYRRRLQITLEISCTTPVWDAHLAKSVPGKGGMDTQSWAKEHYEQLFRATGTMRLENQHYDINATGWRDHSRGPRGGNTRDPWGGHVIVGCQFDSGKAMIFSQYWKPDGVLNLTGGAILDEKGEFTLVDVVDAPRLTSLILRGEQLPIHLKWDGGELITQLETTTSVWIPRERKHLVGRDNVGKLHDIYVLNWGPVRWGDETGYAYIERSAHLNALPASIRPAS